MSSTSPVVLILGAGSNIGHHVTRAFASKGYRVALAARKLKETDNTTDLINITSDFSDPKAVVGVFDKVKSSLGVPPSVVIYNGEFDHCRYCQAYC
jgi:NAD(P)-dependent dehydrogenase (short-subunit alcohol dehydrogenase family)